MRTRMSALLLLGYVPVAAAQVALVAVPVLALLAALPGDTAAAVGIPLGTAVIGGTAYATARALRARRATPAGVPVTRADAPALWELVDGAAAAAGTAPPAGVTVVAEATARLAGRDRLLGVLPGPRELYLGLPLLQAWDTARLRAVVAHELAHLSPAASRWAPLAYRGRTAVARTVPRIGARNPAGPLLRAYARLHRAVDAPVAHAHELAADAVAARYAGPRAAAAVLRDGPALEAAQRIFHLEYVGPGWRAGHAPDDLFGGFLRMLAARADEVAALARRDPPPPGPGDAHPPLAQRLAALAAAESAGPDGAGPDGAGDGARPAGDLVPDLPGLGRAVQAVAYPPQGRTVVGWDAFFTAARDDELGREAQAVLGALSHAAGHPLTGAADVLDLAAAGRLADTVAAALPGPPEGLTGRTVELLEVLLAFAGSRAGALRWRHSWTGSAELVAADGAEVDLRAVAALAADPATVPAARQRLAALGVDPAAAPRPAGPGAPRVVAGLVNLVVDGARTDLLIGDTGLVLVPALPRSRHGEARRRLAGFAAADGPHREAVAPGSRSVAYADVAAAARLRRPRAWRLRLRDGATLTVRAALDSAELPGGWAAFDDAMAYLAGRSPAASRPATSGLNLAAVPSVVMDSRSEF